MLEDDSCSSCGAFLENLVSHKDKLEGLQNEQTLLARIEARFRSHSQEACKNGSEQQRRKRVPPVQDQ